MRTKEQKYPDYSAEIEAIEQGGITDELLNRIIKKHAKNAEYNKRLIERYEALDGCVPIFNREPRFQQEDGESINNRVNNDYFSEINDFKTGYFAGNPIAYSYANTEESLEDTGDAGDSTNEMKEARDIAAKALTDFVALNNMFDKDMESTKNATICGYSGRLLYIDPEGRVRVMVLRATETIILSKDRDITHPTFAVRYYTVTDSNDNEIVKAEFYDSENIYYAEGNRGDLKITGKQINVFDLCPLQGIPNNEEMLGDAEKVLPLIDAHDQILSDAVNEIENFASAYMVFENVIIEEEEFNKMRARGAFQFDTHGQNGGKVYYLTKDIKDAFIEHQLDRIEKNIYRFSKTPNMGDEAFGTASGISLKFKLTGLETKCGMFEAKMISAGNYMFQLLANVWAKKQIKIDPLQCVMTFKRNFPLDLLSEAQAVQALIAAGVPDRVAYELGLSGVDDVEYVMQEKERQKSMIPSLGELIPEDEEEDTEKDTEKEEITE